MYHPTIDTHDFPETISGEYNVNEAQFSNCNSSSLRMGINGNTSSFPNYIANLLFNLEDDTNLLTFQSLKNGRMIYS